MNKISNLIAGALITITVGSCGHNRLEDDSSESIPVFVQMADAEVARTPDPRLIDFRKKPKWEYTNGLLCLAILKAYEETGKQQYLDYVKFYADSMILESGKILTYKMKDYNIDRVNPGRFLIQLNKISPDPRYTKAIDTLRKQMANHPRTSEGGFWHKKRYPHQMWLDGLYMGSPFLTLYAIDYNDPDLLDDVANQFALIDKYLYVEETGLYKHGWDESRDQRWSDPETGRSPHYWGRAMGWFAMAIMDVLTFFPEDHPKYPHLIGTANRIAEAIKSSQDPASGLWWQVLDKPNEAGNYLEASCSSMFVYALLKGINGGFIAESYMEVATSGYKGILDQFIKENADGSISLTNVCAVAGLGGDPYRDGSYEYYINEPQRDNDPKGVGPFIMASILMEDLKNKD